MQPDTRKFLTFGSSLIVIGVIAAILMLTVCGGITHQGPHTNSGWIALMVIMSCLPLGCIAFLFGLAKLVGNRERS